MTKPSLSDYGTYDESTVPRLWDGVVGAWCPSLGPTGSRLYDFSRYNNWGLLTNMDPATDWIVDGGQYALDFDNTNDYVDLGSTLTIDQAAPVSLRWFEKVASTSGTYQSRFILRTSGTRGLIIFRSTNTTGYSVLSVNGKNTGEYSRFSGAPSIASSVGIWREWCLVNTATVGAAGDPWRLWVDGVEYAVSTGSVATAFGNANCRIGLDGLGDDPANCIFDDVTIWRRSLTPGDVQQLYLLGCGGMYQRRRVRRGYVSEAVNRRRRLICGAEC